MERYASITNIRFTQTGYEAISAKIAMEASILNFTKNRPSILEFSFLIKDHMEPNMRGIWFMYPEENTSLNTTCCICNFDCTQTVKDSRSHPC
jgi:hypothetical protein